MTGLRGTGGLLRLALRRDRIKLPAWLAAVFVLNWAEAGAIDGVYPTEESRASYAVTLASSAAARLFGAVDGPSLGSVMMNELFVFMGIIIALICSMLVVRHTRQNEETGRTELLRSGIVGRHADLAAALLLAVGTCVAIGVTNAVALMSVDVPLEGALIMAGAWAGLGLVFAGIAAIASQLSRSARMANGIVGLALTAAFLLRAIGDVTGDVSADGMYVDIGRASWLSPIGWGQLTYPFGAQRGWVLLLYPAAFAACAVLAVMLAARRDFGRGMLPEPSAPARAGRLLSGPYGLAIRLHRTTILAWTASIMLMAAFGGMFAGSVKDMLEGNDTATELFTALGGTDVLVDSYYAIMVAYVALMAAGMAMQVSLRLRSEERGPGEAMLAAGAGRGRWISSHLVVAAVSATLALALSGATMELVGRIAGEPVAPFELVAGSLAQAPAVLVLIGAVALGFGFVPRFSGWLGWGLLTIAVLALFAQALDLPQWLLDVSPFAHVPLAPVDPITPEPLLALGAIAAAATVVGILRFRARDLETTA